MLALAPCLAETVELIFQRHLKAPPRQSALQVIANMTTAYKQERKSVKRKSRGLPSLAFKVEDGMFGSGAGSSLKKLKKGQFVSFQIETVLPPEQSMSGMKKTS